VIQAITGIIIFLINNHKSHHKVDPKSKQILYLYWLLITD